MRTVTNRNSTQFVDDQLKRILRMAPLTVSECSPQRIGGAKGTAKQPKPEKRTMDKKKLAKLVQSIVEETAAKHAIDEASARVFVGIALTQHKATLINSVNLTAPAVAAA